MPNYQFRTLDSGGLNVLNHSRSCRDDNKAMKFAESLITGGGIAHIWEGSRNIGQVFLPLPMAAE